MATTGEWGGLQVRFDIPELRELVDAVNSVFDIIVTALDLALTVLNIVKSFVPSLLNPVKAILRELITALQNIVLDFRQAGFYVHGDWYLLDDTTREQLKGGYSAYERRMITRLTDRRDLERPNFSDSTAALALFFYVGVDLTFVNGLTDFSKFQTLFQLIEGFAQFFGFNTTGSPLPTPTGLRANFNNGATRTATSESAVAALRSSVSRLSGRTSAILQWSLAPSPGSNQSQPAPVIPPNGFLVELSVFPQGLYVGYLTPNPSSTGGVDGVGDPDAAPSYQVGIYEEADTGRPLRVFGGATSIAISESVSWDASFNGTALRPGATPAFFLEDLSSTRLIRTNIFEGPDSTKFYNQRTIYIPHEEVLAQSLVGGVFSLELSASDLPWKTPILDDGTPDFASAKQARTVYVRVLSVSDKVTQPSSFQWEIQPHRNPEHTQVSPKDGLTIADRSPPSSVTEVTFPALETDLYISALNTALAVMILSRSDLTLPSASLAGGEADPGTYQATGLESVAQNLLPLVLPNPQDYFLSSASATAFGEDILAKVGILSDVIVEQQGNLPAAVLAARTERFTRLIEWTWADTTVEGASGLASLGERTILKSLLPENEDGSRSSVYVAKNTRSLDGFPPERSQQKATSLGLIRQFSESSFGLGVLGIPYAAEAAPIVLSANAVGSTRRDSAGAGAAWYARELFTPEVYSISAEVLGLAVADSTAAGGWIAVRPFLGVGKLSGLQEVASSIQDFLETIEAGIEGASDLITNFIAMLEQRVHEIQELIRRVQSYLSIPLSIEIPDALALAVVANGTNGIVSGLVGAENKPTDGPNAYAGGLVVVAGGLPAIITDLLLLLISETS